MTSANDTQLGVVERRGPKPAKNVVRLLREQRRGWVEMVHGSGARAMAQLVPELFVAAFDNWIRRQMTSNCRASADRSGVVLVSAHSVS